MAELNRTPLRHRTLAQVATQPEGTFVRSRVWARQSGDTFEYGVKWSSQASSSGTEKRSVRELFAAGLLDVVPGGPSVYAPRSLTLTDAGRAVLAEWDTKHGPMTEQGSM